MIAAIDKKMELQQTPETVWAAELGGEGYFGWQSHGRFAMRIEGFDPFHRLIWRWAREADKPLDEVHSTVVEWTLLPREDGGTTLLLKESGFSTEESRQENTGGWKHELGELVEFLGSS